MTTRPLVNRAHWAAAVVALAMLGLYCWEIRVWILDDALISFRYAENLAAGHGPVYNVGERVEGYTTFLWVTLLALCNRLGLDTVASARWLGMVFAAASLIALAGLRRFVPAAAQRGGGAAALLLGSCATFTSFGYSGMEVTLTGFLVLLTVLFHLRLESDPRPRWVTVSGVCCALATMARPENALVFLCLLGWHLVVRPAGRHAWLRFAVSYSALYGPYFLWRWIYYGWFLPNTFYAKVGGTWDQVVRGFGYFTDWTGASLLILAPLIAGLFAHRAIVERYGRVGVVPLVILVHATYVVAVGGDGLGAFRFFSPMMPVVCLYSAICLVALVPQRRRVVAFCALAIAFNVWQMLHHPRFRERALGDKTAIHGEITGRWLRDNLDPDMVIATNTAGSIPYYSGLKAIDMLGLNDAHIAHTAIDDMGSGRAGHEKSDGDYVLSRKPDYILFDSAMGSRKPRHTSDRDLWDNPRFREEYSFHTFQLTRTRRLRIYIRNP